MSNHVSGSEGMLQNLKEMQVLYTASLQLVWLKACYATVLTPKQKCGTYPRMHARTRNRKVLDRNRKVFYREVASLRFLRAILGRWDRHSNEQPVPAGGEAAETHVFWEGNRSSPLWNGSKAVLATSCCLFWTCFPLTDCQKRSSLHTSVILTRKPNLGCDEWSICHRALTDFWESTCTIDWQLS